ncbi:NAD(P)-dependent oxidoreductase [Anaeromyxobacter sp. Fw109-5]|uniref:NAD-dependent epimerase/dehydratase family protein n=1 Tax=Anaeromyxobacter sp. (strain Fw109-5) TaxID=404589 RepID=UPI0000ED6E04|nr:NAD(P)-dependent oxidoreductase [Anaeromyxobacter sp. Fw109-5]ABS28237.1 NAD-dependent epimerase/dehydratase [Anaeromyxobacter sp. Fw109-5]
MRIFITGSTGVIGRRVLPALRRAGHELTAVARSPEARERLLRAGVRAIALDLLDRDAVRRAVAGHEVVVNLATHIPAPARMLLPFAWRENDLLRRVASANLSEAALAAGASRFVQESFAFVYADCGEAWVGERSRLEPARHTRSVVDAERAAARFASHGGAGVVLRFAAFYGPDASHLRPLLAAARRGWAALPGDGEAFISSVSHDDAASAVVAALRLPSGVYNVADDEPVRRREYFDLLAGALALPPPRLLPPWVKLLSGSLGETVARSLRISNWKLREAGAWAPRHPSVREGWPATIAALSAQAAPPAVLEAAP